MTAPAEKVRVEGEGEVLARRKALNRLFDAAKPYLDRAAPHEQLFDAEDLRNFEALSKAMVEAEALL